MSHQSGITGGEELQTLLGKAASDKETRMIKVVIENEELQSGGVATAEGDEREDYDKCVLAALEEKECCYILYRLDSEGSNGFHWIFMSYNPDWAHVRDKMVYAATRATLKTLFGIDYIKEEMFGTVPEDINLAGYDKHLESAAAPAPLSMEEAEKEEIRSLEVGAEIGASTKKALMATGVAFPMTPEAEAAIKSFQSGEVTYVQLSLDGKTEMINLELAETLTCEAAAAKIPTDIARYHLFQFNHNHEGDQIESVMFVYSCPSFKMAVKDRMIYSTAKSPLLLQIEGEIGIVVAKKLEIEDGTEFTIDEFYTALHPARSVVSQKFARPKGPAGRKGSSRLTSRASSQKE
eukprot:m.20755 g.20755  ORF g.20755 m.20755 type:complete len:350 (+) comp10284_c0_seq2:1842-2891(+)